MVAAARPLLRHSSITSARRSRREWLTVFCNLVVVAAVISCIAFGKEDYYFNNRNGPARISSSSNIKRARTLLGEASSSTVTSDLVQWAQAQGANMENIKLSHWKGRGAGMMAAKDINVNSSICSIPTDLLMIPCDYSLNNNLRRIFQEKYRDGVDDDRTYGVEESSISADDVQFWVWLIDARRRACAGKSVITHRKGCNKTVDYASYIRALPKCVLEPLTWPEKCLKWLKPSLVYTHAMRGRDYLLKLHEQLLRDIVPEYPPLKDLRLEELIWARSIHFSRSFDAKVNGSCNRYKEDIGKCRSYMMALLDISNHKQDYRIEWRYTPPSATKDGRGKMSYIAHEDIKAGEEVSNNYGQKANDNLLNAYGFVIEDNAYDEHFLPVSASSSPPATVHALDRLRRNEVKGGLFVLKASSSSPSFNSERLLRSNIYAFMAMSRPAPYEYFLDHDLMSLQPEIPLSISHHQHDVDVGVNNDDDDDDPHHHHHHTINYVNDTLKVMGMSRMIKAICLSEWRFYHYMDPTMRAAILDDDEEEHDLNRGNINNKDNISSVSANNEMMQQQQQQQEEEEELQPFFHLAKTYLKGKLKILRSSKKAAMECLHNVSLRLLKKHLNRISKQQIWRSTMASGRDKKKQQQQLYKTRPPPPSLSHYKNNDAEEESSNSEKEEEEGGKEDAVFTTNKKNTVIDVGGDDDGGSGRDDNAAAATAATKKKMKKKKREDDDSPSLPPPPKWSNFEDISGPQAGSLQSYGSWIILNGGKVNPSLFFDDATTMERRIMHNDDDELNLFSSTMENNNKKKNNKNNTDLAETRNNHEMGGMNENSDNVPPPPPPPPLFNKHHQSVNAAKQARAYMIPNESMMACKDQPLQRIFLEGNCTRSNDSASNGDVNLGGYHGDDWKAGDIMAELPAEALIGDHTASLDLGEFGTALSSYKGRQIMKEANPRCYLMLHLIDEYSKGYKSKWWPLLKTLPRSPREDSLLSLLITNTTLQDMIPLTALASFQEIYEPLVENYNILFPALTLNFPQAFPAYSFTLKAFVWAHQMMERFSLTLPAMPPPPPNITTGTNTTANIGEYGTYEKLCMMPLHPVIDNVAFEWVGDWVARPSELQKGGWQMLNNKNGGAGKRRKNIRKTKRASQDEEDHHHHHHHHHNSNSNDEKNTTTGNHDDDYNFAVPEKPMRVLKLRANIDAKDWRSIRCSSASSSSSSSSSTQTKSSDGEATYPPPHQFITRTFDNSRMIFLHDTVIDKYEADFVEITARALEAYVIDQHCSTSSRNSAQDEEEDDEKEETERVIRDQHHLLHPLKKRVIEEHIRTLGDSEVHLLRPIHNPYSRRLVDFIRICMLPDEFFSLKRLLPPSSTSTSQSSSLLPTNHSLSSTTKGLTLAASLVSDICNNEAGSIIPWHQYEDAQYYNTATKTTTNSDNSNNMVEEEKSYTIQKLKIPSESQTLEALKGYLVSLVENLIDERDPAAAASDDDDDTATGDCSEEQATLKEAMNRLATQHINTLQIAIQTLDKQLQALL